jgi:S-(hydroxymethyl)glutathione dehydrogenase / alcohol dehydrogenase
VQAAVFYSAHQPLEIEELAVDNPRGREVLLRVAASALCHSDLHMMKGDIPCAAPLVLGHEAAGIVEAVGAEVTSFKAGDHVVCCTALYCGACNPCLSGKSNRCTQRPGRKGDDPSTITLLNGKKLVQHGSVGGFAEQMLVHENALVLVPRELPLDRAALLGCGVLTGAGSVFNSANVQPGSSVVVIGCGGVGLNVIQASRIAGAERIIAVDLAPEKLELARKFGATDTVLGGASAVEGVKQCARGGVDYAFEVIGLPQTIQQGVQMLAKGGLMTIVGAIRFDAAVTLPTLALLVNEWRIQGSFLGSGPFKRDVPRLASLYLKGRLDLDGLISERIPLAPINRGFDTMLGGTQARSVIIFDDVLKQGAGHA